jgi:hypothetical protein
MALKKSFTKIDNFGIEVNLKDCYVKVIAVFATKDEAQMSVNVFETANGRSYFSENHKFQIDLNGDNPIKQGYLYLKTLAEYSDAVDC